MHSENDKLKYNKRLPECHGFNIVAIAYTSIILECRL
jgi:hypothetical protein